MKNTILLLVLLLSNFVVVSQTNRDPINKGDTIKLNKLVSDLADSIFKKVDWQSLVGTAAEDIELVLRATIDAENSADVKIMADIYKSIIDKVIADAVANGRTVPDSLRNLSEELNEKSKQADNFLKK
jgi:hypothetical protein